MDNKSSVLKSHFETPSPQDASCSTLESEVQHYSLSYPDTESEDSRERDSLEEYALELSTRVSHLSDPGSDCGWDELRVSDRLFIPWEVYCSIKMRALRALHSVAFAPVLKAIVNVVLVRAFVHAPVIDAEYVVTEERAFLDHIRGYGVRSADELAQMSQRELVRLFARMAHGGLRFLEWAATSAKHQFRRAAQVALQAQRNGRLATLALKAQGRTARKRPPNHAWKFWRPPSAVYHSPEVYRVRRFGRAERCERPRPASFSVQHFTRWVAWCARVAMASEGHVRGAFPYVDELTWRVMHGGWHGRRRDLVLFLQRCSVRVYRPAEWAASRGLGGPLYVCGRPCTPSTYRDHVRCLRRHRTAWLSVVSYMDALRDGVASSEDELRVRTDLRRFGVDQRHRHSECLHFQGNVPGGQVTFTPDGSQIPPVRPRKDPDVVGSSSFMNWTITHRVEGLQDAIDALRTSIGVLAPTLAQELARFLALLGALLVMDTPVQIAASIAQYVAGIPGLCSVAQAGLLRLQALAQKVPQTLTLQSRSRSGSLESEGSNGDETPVSPAPTPFEAFKTQVSDFFSELRDLLGACFAWPLLTGMFGTLSSLILEDTRAVTDVFKRAVVMESAKEFARNFLEGAKELLRRLRQCYEQSSLTPLFGSRWDPVRWQREVIGMIRYFPQLTCRQGTEAADSSHVARLVEAGEIPASFRTRVSLAVFKEVLEKYERDGEKLLGAEPKLVGVAQALAQLRTLKTTIAGMEFGADYRPEPFGIYLHGPAGTGKSTLAGFLMQAIGNANGYDTSPTARYTWDPVANFQDGLDHLTWCVLFDDVDQSVAKPTAGIPTHFDSFLKVVNTTPFLPEQAAVEMKGRVVAQPLLAIYCSNFANANLRGKCMQPTAFWRRCKVYAEVRASASYRSPAGTKIEPALTDGVGFDAAAWEIHYHVESPSPSGDPFDPPFVFSKVMSVGEFARVVGEAYKVHMAKQMGRLCVPSKDFCPVCYLPRHLECGCMDVHLQCLRAKRKPLGADLVQHARGDATQLEELRSALGVTIEHLDATDLPLVASEYLDLDAFPAWVVAVDSDDVALEIERLSRLCAQSYVLVDGKYRYAGARVLTGPTVLFPNTDVLRDLPSRARDADSLELATTVLAAHFPRGGHGWRDYGARLLERIRGRSDDVGIEMITSRGWHVVRPLDSMKGDDRVWAAMVAAALAVSGKVVLAAVGISIGALTGVLAYQSRVSNGVADLVPPTWKMADQHFSPSLPPPLPGSHFTKEQLLQQVRESILPISGENEAGAVVDGYAIVLGHGLIATVTHGVAMGKAFEVVLPTGEKVSGIRTPLNSAVSPSNRELLYLTCDRVSARYSIYKYIQPVIDEGQQTFDEVEVYTGGGQRLLSNTVVQAAYVWWGPERLIRVRTDEVTPDGSCGSLYVARTGDRWRVVGMHFAMMPPSLTIPRCPVAITLSKILIAREVEPLGLQPQSLVLAPGLVRRSAPQNCWIAVGPFNQYSEVWKAHEQGAVLTPYGRLLDPTSRGKSVSKVRRNPFDHEFEDLEVKYCGEFGYWGRPSYARGMRDGRYESPYQRSLLAYSTSRPVHVKTFWLAVLDYVNGMHELDPTGFERLSEAQAITGVPGTWIGPLDPRTSTGPPWNQKKYLHFARAEWEAAYSPEMAEIFRQIDAALAEGDIPVPVARGVLKDEVRAKGKLARLFSVLSAAWNVRFKQDMAPISVFERSFPEFFESAIGIDMTSADCSRIPVALAQVDPRLERVEDGDYSVMDSCYGFYTHLFGTLVDYAKAYHLGIDPLRAETWSVAIQSTIIEIGGDLAETPRQPSGNFRTGEKNSAANSFVHRYAYYRSRHHLYPDEEVQRRVATFRSHPRVDWPALDFRRKVVLWTYGDDYLKTTIPPGPGGPVSFDWEAVREELGFKVTDSQKEGPPAPKPFTRVQFLKRTFEYDGTLDRWVAKLDMKSVVRMCVARLPSTLSDTDHYAELLTQAMREAAFHSSEEYEAVRSAALRSARSFGFIDSPRFRAPTYAEIREVMRTPGYRVYEGGLLEERVALPEDACDRD